MDFDIKIRKTNAAYAMTNYYIETDEYEVITEKNLFKIYEIIQNLFNLFENTMYTSYTIIH